MKRPIDFETQERIAVRLGYISEKQMQDLDKAVNILKNLLPDRYTRCACEILWEMTQYCDFDEIVSDVRDLRKMTTDDLERVKDERYLGAVDEIIGRLSLPPKTVIRIINETAGHEIV